MTILVTGSTGFIGRHLAAELLGRGERVRCLVRSAADRARLPDPRAEIVEGDFLRPETLDAAVAGAEAVVHLVHGLGRERPAEGITIETIEQEGTEHLLAACRRHGVKRLVYVSICGARADATNRLLRNRWAVEELIRAGGVSYAILRAPLVIGRGSSSFELLVHHIQTSPVLLLVGDGRNRVQYLALSDLLAYLAGALAREDALQRTFDVGHPDPVTLDELVAAIEDAVSRHPYTLHVPAWLARLPLEAANEAFPHSTVAGDLVAWMEQDIVGDVTAALATFPVRPKGLAWCLREAGLGEPGAGG